ncbi:MAG: insulinase family protein [Candidatus Fermentibacteraceae bacterium]|nr:insulinase family protein [Candidatus Fermentibacteraceae bacterium]MBN2609349.1 insulinase family protein [Candidatus Fermentibacteraceae bacterium]
MRKALLLLAVSLPAVSTAQIPPDVSEFSLSNGIPVISRTVANNEIEGVSLFIIGGSSALSEQTQGLERFALECAVMGSEDYPGPVWRDLMDRTQAQWTSSFNYDYSRYHLKCISEDLAQLLVAFGDCLLNPELDPQALEQVRISTVQDLQDKRTDPDSWVWLVANDAFMPGHTYRKLPDGTEETVSSFTEDDVRTMLDIRIRAGSLLITHAGPTAPEELREILEAAFGDIPAGGQEYPPVGPFTVDADTLVIQQREVPTAYVVVKFNAPPQGHPDLLPFRMALTVIDDLLWQVLRTDNALTYATYAGATTYRENWGYMYVSTPEPARACSLMAGVLRGMIDDPVDGGLVEGTIEKSLTRMRLTAASKADQCWMMGSYQISTGDWRNAFTEVENASGITSEELSAVLERWIGNGGWGIIADTTSVNPDRLRPWPLN